MRTPNYRRCVYHCTNFVFFPPPSKRTGVCAHTSFDLRLNWQAIRLSQETHEEEIRRRQPERSRGQRQGVHGAEIDSDQIDCDALDSPVEVEEPPPPPRTEAPEGEDGSDRPRRRGTGGDAGVSHDSDDHSADHAKLEAKFFESSTSKSKRSGITEPNRIEPAPLTGVNDMTPNNGRKESKGGRGDSDDSILLLI